ncbi:MAG: hypothetical protein A2275_12710 [Bacteroidetes bacterium RIFOXYA12_FULL_35_11]|nr:MAG: hypothetical protein A2X01_03100 [Bacteroidetes bacterium GWF2_35_48]OFY76497.1 MAG: hypothetical protein A2275_12710 [Bacteroidetes bacterium RIFOXYA12_FULL_35_11]OFY99960.1 MAG: hypothetical protein A2491_13140 [Bacteroidetes bacterium RIFOXYC12_FULL_35_7]HBX51410.1 hypothetical protein [Bacteroidales bacterium]
MKKVSLILAIVFGLFNIAEAQTETVPASGSGDCLTSKKGCKILPESGDYAFGIDATPIFNLIGNLTKINSGTTFTDPSSFNFMDGTNSIYAKYFVDESTAYRGKIRIMVNNTKDVEFVNDVTSTSIPPLQVKDVESSFSTGIVLGGGLEKRKGKTRLQGFYGGEALLFYSTNSTKYTYGNALSPTSPVRTNIFDPAMDGVISDKSGKTFGIGARAFAGIEYFFTPKIALGGEFGWGINFNTTGKGVMESEEWNFTDGDVKKITTETAGGSMLDIDTDNFGGSIYLIFHF